MKQGKYGTIEDIKRANREAGRYWFSPDTLRFFRSRVGREVYGGRFFISSEQRETYTERRYTVREAMPDGTIENASKFMAYPSSQSARNHIDKLLSEKGMNEQQRDALLDQMSEDGYKEVLEYTENNRYVLGIELETYDDSTPVRNRNVEKFYNREQYELWYDRTHSPVKYMDR
jgi:hypothetical protein